MADTELIDPLGRRTTLHDAAWYGHVVKRHPDMRPLRIAVEEAVRNPTTICFSRYDSACRIYYSPHRAIMIAAVADIVEGVVLTAYRTSRVKGAIEWSASTP